MRENTRGSVVSSSESMTNPDPVKAHLVDAQLNLQLQERNVIFFLANDILALRC